MTAVKNKKAFSLAEIMVVIAIIAILATIVIPASKTLIESFEMDSQIKPVIGTALANARALAISRKGYAGIRFQQDLHGDQYMILIVHDRISTGLANGFMAAQGRTPMKLPEVVGVMDLMVNESPVANDADIENQVQLNDTTTFSILFSPAGRLITHMVRVRNKDGLTDGSGTFSSDEVFNTIDSIDIYEVGKFVQDDYWDPADPDSGEALGYGPENSRKGFVIYKKSRLKETKPDHRWSNYLSKLEMIYVNPYSGHMISN